MKRIVFSETVRTLHLLGLLQQQKIVTALFNYL